MLKKSEKIYTLSMGIASYVVTADKNRHHLTIAERGSKIHKVEVNGNEYNVELGADGASIVRENADFMVEEVAFYMDKGRLIPTWLLKHDIGYSCEKSRLYFDEGKRLQPGEKVSWRDGIHTSLSYKDGEFSVNRPYCFEKGAATHGDKLDKEDLMAYATPFYLAVKLATQSSAVHPVVRERYKAAIAKTERSFGLQLSQIENLR